MSRAYPKRAGLAGAWWAAAFLASAAPPAAALVLPPDGIVLTQVHIQFEWDGDGISTSYDLEVVVDDGSSDPFDGAAPVATPSVGAVPRAVVSTGLVFGESYAWRTRGDAAPGWGPTRRFDIAAVPTEFPTFVITTFGGSVQPGLTLFNLRRGNGASASYLLAVTETGDLVWYLPWDGIVSDVRLLDSGRVLFVGNNRGVEALLNGQIAWKSPDDDDLPVHHEVMSLPGGDVLAIVNRFEDIELDGVTKSWNGDEIIVFQRATNQIIWRWNAFDHLSILDHDEQKYATSGQTFDWTHANSATYEPADGSINFSVRHLSRIVNIDYPSGAINYQMGFAMPSGQAPFGDNLFSWQHSPELQPNGNLLIYDNGNRRDHIVQTEATGVTKAVEVAFSGDPPTSASIVWEWTLPTYNRGFGDADRLANGNTLVVAGRHQTIHEVDANGQEVWRLESVLGSADFNIYRADRIPALVLDVPGDSDGDGLADVADNCPDHPNPGQEDADGNGFGDLCGAILGFDPVVVPALAPGGLVGLWLLAMLGGVRALAGWGSRRR
jgi:hypothetical protein